MSDDTVKFGGTYHITRRRAGQDSAVTLHNTVTWAAVDDFMLRGLTSRSWEVGLKQGGEGTPYDTPQARVWTDSPFNAAGTRPAWTPASIGAGLISNRDAPARIVVEQDAPTDGVYIISADGAVVLSVAEWYATQDLLAGDELTVTYELDAGPA